MSLHIGTSGWSYNHWEGVLYPPGTPVRRRLDHYVQRFQTVEVNASYYHWPRDRTFTQWRERLPEGFLLSLKAPRGLTHFARLRAPETWLERITRGVSELGSNRGVLLAQLPPRFPFDYPRLEYFLQQVPDWLKLGVEFRDASWNREEVFNLLERFGVAYCVMSGAQLPCVLRATAPFVYVRLHGPDPNHLYGGSYSEDDLRWWADRIREWQQMGRDVFAYFNNDWEGHAVRNAATLKWLLGV